MSKYILELEGDFEKGDCYSCPLALIAYELFRDDNPHCMADCESESCPLEEVKQGEWVADGIAAVCDQCHKFIVVEQGDAELNYCPNCGAKMEGGKE